MSSDEVAALAVAVASGPYFEFESGDTSLLVKVNDEKPLRSCELVCSLVCEPRLEEYPQPSVSGAG